MPGYVGSTRGFLQILPAPGVSQGFDMEVSFNSGIPIIIIPGMRTPEIRDPSFLEPPKRHIFSCRYFEGRLENKLENP